MHGIMNIFMELSYFRRQLYEINVGYILWLKFELMEMACDTLDSYIGV